MRFYLQSGPLLLLILLWSSIAVAEPLKPGRNKITLEHAGRTRNAIVRVPEGAPPKAGWPLVLMLHGGGGSAEHLDRRSSWVALARREGAVLVLPNGTPRDEEKPRSLTGNPQTWNDGGKASLSTGSQSAAGKGIDDSGFLVALLDEVAKRTPVDSARVFVAGHSNGSGMAYRVAAEHPERFAAVGVVAGHFRVDDPPRESPVPLLQITGSEDPLVPLEGGRVGIGLRKTEMPPAITSPERWARLNGNKGEPAVVEDSREFLTRRWGKEGSREEVLFIVVKGHGHNWPGDASPLPEAVVGPDSGTLDATAKVWEFFAVER
ncbi:MAG: PHB depolymerase family esterase [Candidatus Sumerlaeia bacterium]|nr:PHB depolymerase family esterase [Candidatus Sumerlaeia bacterium]